MLRPTDKEIELPETLFERDVEMKAFRTMVLNSLMSVEGVYFIEENLMDSLLGKDNAEGVRGIEVEQDKGQPSLSVSIEIMLGVGLSIPEKVDEIQNKVIEELTRYSGAHISKVQVIVKDVVIPPKVKKEIDERTIITSSLTDLEGDDS